MITLGTGAAQLNLLFQIASARTITFYFNVDVSSWAFEFVLRAYKGARTKTLSIIPSIPIYGETEVQCAFTGTQTNLKEGEYYWELRRTDLNVPIVNGKAYFSFDAPDGNDNDNTFEFNLNSQTVELTISNTITSSSSGGALSSQYFNGDSIQTQFTLTSGSPVFVEQGGIIQIPNIDYTVSGKTVTFTTAPYTTIGIYYV